MGFISTLGIYGSLLFEWVKAHRLFLGIISVTSLVASLISCVAVIAYLPSDYFIIKKQMIRIKRPILRVCFIFLKNLIAMIFIIVGIIQIPLPGQGVLTILIGIIISDIPGKRLWERRIIQIPAVFKAANLIRLHLKRSPFVLEAKEE